MTTPAADQTNVLKEWRCQKCNRVLAEIAIRDGAIRKICDRCKTVNWLEVRK